MKAEDNYKQDFNALKTKILLQTAFIGVLAIALTVVGYTLFLRGSIANVIVYLMQNLFRVNYETALNYYQTLIRDNLGIIFISITVLLYFVIFMIYLSNFTKYFRAINLGINALIEDKNGEIILLPELSATEKKLNALKQELISRKQQAQHAEARKNDLVVYLAHDLKTPLTSVIGYLTLLHDENEISPQLREKYLAISLKKAEHLENLINEFFEITRFNLSNISLTLASVNLTRMLEQLTFEFKPMLEHKKLQCEINAEAEIMIKCDADKMQRVFDNLLRNAVNYSFEESIITITAIAEQGNIKIAFTNHGNTISSEKLERIFEQFYRLDSARESKNGGAGLGLAIAKEIIELHGGTITAHSKDDTIAFEIVIPEK